MKKVALLMLFMGICTVSFAQDSDPIGIRVGMEMRTGDVLNGYDKDGYTPEFNTNVYYGTDFSKYGVDWLSLVIGAEFSLQNIGAPDVTSGDGAGALMSAIESSIGLSFDIYKGLYFSFVFDTDDWIGFYLGWTGVWDKHSFNIQAGTAANWNPNADVYDAKDNALYNHLDTPFELYATYSYDFGNDWTINAGLGYVIPYALNQDYNGSEYDYTVAMHRIEPSIGFSYGMFDMTFKLRMQYYANAIDGYDEGDFSIEPRIAMGVSF